MWAFLRYHRVRFDKRHKYSRAVQIWHERQSITRSKHGRQNNVHRWNADRIRDCHIALAAAARMVMRNCGDSALYSPRTLPVAANVAS
jgi:hypothetical protein